MLGDSVLTFMMLKRDSKPEPWMSLTWIRLFVSIELCEVVVSR